MMKTTRKMKNSTSTVVDRGLAAARDRLTATEGENDETRDSRLSRRRATANANANATACRRRALRDGPDRTREFTTRERANANPSETTTRRHDARIHPAFRATERRRRRRSARRRGDSFHSFALGGWRRLERDDTACRARLFEIPREREGSNDGERR
jgi:hypothetical protein